jgi:hypothetical protein
MFDPSGLLTSGSLRSFQLTDQAIDSYQNSESEMHSHCHNKHQDSNLDADNLCCQQQNDHAGKTHERSNDANDKLWRPILGHRPRGPLAAFGYGRLGGAASERSAINLDGLGIRFTPSAG